MVWRSFPVILVKKQTFGRIAYLSNNKQLQLLVQNHQPANKMKWSWKCDDEAVYWSAAISSSVDNSAVSNDLCLAGAFARGGRGGTAGRGGLAWLCHQITKSTHKPLVPNWLFPHFCCINKWIFLQIQIRRHFRSDDDNFECEQICFLRQCCVVCVWEQLLDLNGMGSLVSLLSEMLF